MKPKTLVLLAVAVGCGLVAMLGIQQAMQGGQSGGTPKVRVLVALRDIPPGIELTEEMIGFKELPVDAVPEDAVTSIEQYEERSLTFAAATDDIIRQSKLGERGEFTHSRQIPPGMRVISINVNETHTLSGMLSPGDRIDVLVTFKARDVRGRMSTKTKTLLEYIEVFAMANRTVNDAGTKQQEQKTKVVSLLVSPEQVSYIKLAESKGDLALSWRNPDDNESVNPGEIDENLLVELEGTDNFNVSSGMQAGMGDDMNGVQAFLDSQALAAMSEEPAAQAVEPQVEPVAEPEPPPVKTWNVEIFYGNETRQTEFVLPEEPSEEGDTPENDAAGDQASLTDAFQWLHRQFTQGQSSTAGL